MLMHNAQRRHIKAQPYGMQRQLQVAFKGKARQGKARQGKARQGKAGKARQCRAEQGRAGQGRAGQDNARQGKARQYGLLHYGAHALRQFALSWNMLPEKDKRCVALRCRQVM